MLLSMFLDLDRMGVGAAQVRTALGGWAATVADKLPPNRAADGTAESVAYGVAVFSILVHVGQIHGCPMEWLLWFSAALATMVVKRCFRLQRCLPMGSDRTYVEAFLAARTGVLSEPPRSTLDAEVVSRPGRRAGAEVSRKSENVYKLPLETEDFQGGTINLPYAAFKKNVQTAIKFYGIASERDALLYLFRHLSKDLRWELVSLAGVDNPPLATVWRLLDDKFGHGDTPGTVANRWEAFAQGEGESVSDLYTRLLRERSLYSQVAGTQLPPAVVAAKFVSALAPGLRDSLETAWGRALGDFTVEQVREHALFYEGKHTSDEIAGTDKGSKNRKANNSSHPNGKPVTGPALAAGSGSGQPRSQPSQPTQAPSGQRGGATSVRCKYCSERGYKKADKHSDASCWENPVNASKRPPWFKPLEGRAPRASGPTSSAVVEAGKTFMTCSKSGQGLIGIEALLEDGLTPKRLPTLLLLDTGSEYTLASSQLLSALGVEVVSYESPMVLAAAGEGGTITVIGEATLSVLVYGDDGKWYRFHLVAHVAVDLNPMVAETSSILLGLNAMRNMGAQIAVGDASVFLKAMDVNVKLTRWGAPSALTTAPHPVPSAQPVWVRLQQSMGNGFTYYHSLDHEPEGLQFVITADASPAAGAAVLWRMSRDAFLKHKDEISASWLAENGQLIGFFTHRWNAAEQNYDIACKELHIICHGLAYWRQLLLTYIMHHPRGSKDASTGRIVVFSDSSSALGKLAARSDMTRYQPDARQVKRWLGWLSLVMEFDHAELEFCHIPGRLNGFSDLLSRLVDNGRRYVPEGGGNPVVLVTVRAPAQSPSDREQAQEELARILCDDGVSSEMSELQKADGETRVHGASLAECPSDAVLDAVLEPTRTPTDELQILADSSEVPAELQKVLSHSVGRAGLATLYSHIRDDVRALAHRTGRLPVDGELVVWRRPGAQPIEGHIRLVSGVNVADGPFTYLGKLTGHTTRMVPLGAGEEFSISVSPAHLEPRAEAVDWNRPAVATEITIPSSAVAPGDMLLVRLADGGDVIGRVTADDTDQSDESAFLVHVYDSPDGTAFWPVWLSKDGETYASETPVDGDVPLQRLREATRQDLLQAGYLSGYPLAETGEVFILRRDNIVFSAKGPSFGSLRATGDAFLTNKRLVFVIRKDGSGSRADFYSAAVPLSAWNSPKFEQPVFGANFIEGVAPDPIPGAGDCRFSYTFNSGGCGTFLPLFFRLHAAAGSGHSGGPGDRVRSTNASFVRAVLAGDLSRVGFQDPSDPSVIYVAQPPQPRDNIATKRHHRVPSALLLALCIIAGYTVSTALFVGARDRLRLSGVPNAAFPSKGLRARNFAMSATSKSGSSPSLRVPLPYAMSELQPVISAATVDFHYNKHHQGYVTKLLDATGFPESKIDLESLVSVGPSKVGEAVFNSAGQIYNHNMYWLSMAPAAAVNVPVPSRLGELIRSRWGSMASMKNEFIRQGTALFGSGWIWLVWDEGTKQLEFVATKDAHSPLSNSDSQIPLLTCDVWEHAYYLDYQHDRASYLNKWWSIIDWKFAESNLPNDLALLGSAKLANSDNLAAASTSTVLSNSCLTGLLALPDRSAYITRLEDQLERVTSSCLAVQAFSERISKVGNHCDELEARVSNLARQLRELQASQMDRGTPEEQSSSVAYWQQSMERRITKLEAELRRPSPRRDDRIARAGSMAEESVPSRSSLVEDLTDQIRVFEAEVMSRLDTVEDMSQRLAEEAMSQVEEVKNSVDALRSTVRTTEALTTQRINEGLQRVSRVLKRVVQAQKVTQQRLAREAVPPARDYPEDREQAPENDLNGTSDLHEVEEDADGLAETMPAGPWLPEGSEGFPAKDHPRSRSVSPIPVRDRAGSDRPTATHVINLRGEMTLTKTSAGRASLPGMEPLTSDTDEPSEIHTTPRVLRPSPKGQRAYSAPPRNNRKTPAPAGTGTGGLLNTRAAREKRQAEIASLVKELQLLEREEKEFHRQSRLRAQRLQRGQQGAFKSKGGTAVGTHDVSASGLTCTPRARQLTRS
ncbi:Sodb2p [Perkinsus chesapeaki]|uniref:Superoxide dismutase [Fe] n=1 Tax=Perkinsus chesapeaki TaxID=330153 RepID=A0A7J6LTL3_PERCH|nr:Sodb2p [Perkinsus chesapeaki]